MTSSSRTAMDSNSRSRSTTAIERLPTWLRHPLIIARTELTRTFRNTSDSAGMTLYAVFGGIFIIFYTLLLGGGAYVLGADLGARGGSLATDTGELAASAVGFPLLIGVFTIAQRTIKTRGTIQQVTPLLTTIPHSELVAGTVLAECFTVLLLAGLPALGIAVGLAVGTGSILTFVLSLVSLLGLVALIVSFGFTVGVFVKLIAARSQFITRHKTGISIVVSLVFFGGYLLLFANTGGNFAGAFAEFATPFEWFVALALVAVSGSAGTLVQAGIAALSIIVGTTVLLGLSIRMTARLWYRASVQPDHGSSSTVLAGVGSTASTPSAESSTATPEVTAEPTTSVLSSGSLSNSLADRLLDERASEAVRGVMATSWRRAWRAPFTLQYAVFPLFLLFYPIQTVLSTGSVPSTLPLTLALACPWAVGAAFTLNPIGAEGQMLPITLTSRVPGQRFIRGLCLAGLIPGLPVTLIVVILTALVSSLPISAAVVLGLASVVLCGCAVFVASGIGVTYPSFERTEIRGGQEAVIPSLFAFIVYSLCLGIVALPALSVHLIDVPAVLGWGIDQFALFTLGGATVLTAILAGGSSFLAYRHAAQAFDEYRF